MNNETVKKSWIPCNLCAGTEFQQLYPNELGSRPPLTDHDFQPETRKTYAIVKCSGCGMIFTNPMPDLKDIYEETIDHVYLASEKQRRATAKHVLGEVRKHVGGGRLLDVGCHTGLFLDEATRHFEVEGVELSKWAAEQTARNHTVYTVPLDELNLKSRFDVVTLFGVIEHFDDPRKELDNIARLLKPGGLFVIYTGDVDAWLPRYLGKRWWWYQGMHLFYFSYRTLKSMLGRSGFDIVDKKNHVVFFQLFSLANSLNRYRIGRFLRPLLNASIIKNFMVGLRLSGEMLVFARKEIPRQRHAVPIRPRNE